MNSSAAPDPFEDTKMTFGEHLEELRGALLRSVLGIIIGLVVAFPIAPTVVRWIEWPLQRALKTHYLVAATDKIQQSDFDDAAPERLTGIEQFNMVPERMYLDRFELAQQLSTTPGESHLLREFEYQPEDLTESTDGALRIAQTLLKHSQEAEDSPQKAVWRQFSAATREAVTQIADTASRGLSARAALAAALNEAMRQPALHRDSAFGTLDGIFGKDRQRQALVERLRAELDQDFSDPRSMNLNRQLLDAVFRGYTKPSRPSLVEFTVWRPIDVSVQALSVHEPFMIYLKAALIVGFILASPWVFYQIWAFVAAGLYPHEKRFVHSFLPFSIGLFLAGAAMAFFLVFQPVLDFLLQFNRAMGISAEPRITDWLSFVLLLPIGFGISFQLPLVMLFLERIGVMSVENYLAHWRIAVLTIFVLSMILTPADPISMLMMGVPLTGLYFVGIGLCRAFPRQAIPDAP